MDPVFCEPTTVRRDQMADRDIRSAVNARLMKDGGVQAHMIDVEVREGGRGR
jgi:osmotically-inducible protein OsmY